MHMKINLMHDPFNDRSFIRVDYFKTMDALKFPERHLNDVFFCTSQFDINKLKDGVSLIDDLIKVINISVNELLSK